MLQLAEDKKRPPVNSWHPEMRGEIDIRIQANGEWFYQGELMSRKEVVELLSGIMRFSDDGYWLVTPVEMLKIQVDDVPFMIVSMNVHQTEKGQSLEFITNVGDHIILSEQNPLNMKLYNKAIQPYVEIRDGLLAKLSRPVYYEMLEYAECINELEELYAVRSAGDVFALSVNE